MSVLYFNSIKVRLELYSSICFFALSAYFNSIKVRLEQRAFIQSINQISTFQFHKGAIRTSIQNLDATQDQDFNSIKVRLEQAETQEAQLPIMISIP